ncbi:MAG: hypothetical protein ACPGUD_05100 [Parashewanella sp.]
MSLSETIPDDDSLLYLRNIVDYINGIVLEKPIPSFFQTQLEELNRRLFIPQQQVYCEGVAEFESETLSEVSTSGYNPPSQDVLAIPPIEDSADHDIASEQLKALFEALSDISSLDSDKYFEHQLAQFKENFAQLHTIIELNEHVETVTLSVKIKRRRSDNLLIHERLSKVNDMTAHCQQRRYQQLRLQVFENLKQLLERVHLCHMSAKNVPAASMEKLQGYVNDLHKELDEPLKNEFSETLTWLQEYHRTNGVAATIPSSIQSYFQLMLSEIEAYQQQESIVQGIELSSAVEVYTVEAEQDKFQLSLTPTVRIKPQAKVHQFGEPLALTVMVTWKYQPAEFIKIRADFASQETGLPVRCLIGNFVQYFRGGRAIVLPRGTSYLPKAPNYSVSQFRPITVLFEGFRIATIVSNELMVVLDPEQLSVVAPFKTNALTNRLQNQNAETEQQVEDIVNDREGSAGNKRLLSINALYRKQQEHHRRFAAVDQVNKTSSHFIVADKCWSQPKVISNEKLNKFQKGLRPHNEVLVRAIPERAIVAIMHSNQICGDWDESAPAYENCPLWYLAKRLDYHTKIEDKNSSIWRVRRLPFVIYNVRRGKIVEINYLEDVLTAKQLKILGTQTTELEALLSLEHLSVNEHLLSIKESICRDVEGLFDACQRYGKKFNMFSKLLFSCPLKLQLSFLEQVEFVKNGHDLIEVFWTIAFNQPLILQQPRSEKITIEQLIDKYHYGPRNLEELTQCVDQEIVPYQLKRTASLIDAGLCVVCCQSYCELIQQIGIALSEQEWLLLTYVSCIVQAGNSKYVADQIKRAFSGDFANEVITEICLSVAALEQPSMSLSMRATLYYKVLTFSLTLSQLCKGDKESSITDMSIHESITAELNVIDDVLENASAYEWLNELVHSMIDLAHLAGVGAKSDARERMSCVHRFQLAPLTEELRKQLRDQIIFSPSIVDCMHQIVDDNFKRALFLMAGVKNDQTEQLSQIELFDELTLINKLCVGSRIMRRELEPIISRLRESGIAKPTENLSVKELQNAYNDPEIVKLLVTEQSKVLPKSLFKAVRLS